MERKEVEATFLSEGMTDTSVGIRAHSAELDTGQAQH